MRLCEPSEAPPDCICSRVSRLPMRYLTLEPRKGMRQSRRCCAQRSHSLTLAEEATGNHTPLSISACSWPGAQPQRCSMNLKSSTFAFPVATMWSASLTAPPMYTFDKIIQDLGARSEDKPRKQTTGVTLTVPAVAGFRGRVGRDTDIARGTAKKCHHSDRPSLRLVVSSTKLATPGCRSFCSCRVWLNSGCLYCWKLHDTKYDVIFLVLPRPPPD